LKNRIGSGGSGVVYKAENSAGNIIAVKIIENKNPNENLSAEREVFLKSLSSKSKYLVKIIDCFDGVL
jgi:serine/threonine protein kinase